jgi:hypothetical protein
MKYDETRERPQMNRSTPGHAGATETRRAGASARVRGLALGLAFAAGIAAGAWWFSRADAPAPAAPESSGPPALSEASKAVLRRLGSPVEIRFYSLLDPAGVGDSGREFSGRVDRLLSQYEQEAGGKIRVLRVNSISSAAANAALADGIKPFNLDKGDACYLGIAVVRGGHTAALASLAPEWEPALESDLSRAIADIDASDPPAPLAARADAATLEAVRRAVPNVDSVSVAEGSRLLRVAALAQFQKSAQEMQARVKQAEDHLLLAQNSQSEAEQEAALKDLQQARKEQSQRLTDIALEKKAQVEALQQLKGAAN